MDIAPRRVLLPLTAAVLLAHLGLLQYASHAARQPAAGAVAPLTTRMIAPEPAPVGAAAAVPAAAPTPPAPRPAAKPARVTPPKPKPVEPSAPAPSPTPTSPPASDGTAVAAWTAPGLAAGPGALPSADVSPTTAASAPAPAPAASAAMPAASSPAAVASAVTPASSAPSDDQRRLLATRYQALPSVRLGYDVLAEVKGIPLRAQGELLWQNDGSTYTARMEIKAFLLGSRVQTSAGRVTEHALAPTRFSDKTRSELAAHFRQTEGRVTFSANTPDAPLRPMAQDRLSIFLQLAGMLAAEPAKYPSGTHISMQTVGPRSAEDWDFSVEAEEPLDLAGGRVMGLKLVHAPALDFDQRVELWFAPARGYAPVRIRITQADGSFVDMQWRTDSPP